MKKKRNPGIGLVGALALLGLVPLLFILTGSFMSEDELVRSLAPMVQEGDGYIAWRLVPVYPTLQHYKEVLLDAPEFFVMFWNTVKMTALIMAGQLLVGIPAAWGLSRYKWRGRKGVYLLYVLLMMLPFQVTMLSNYLLLRRVELLDTMWGIVLPSVFSTYPVFIMYRFFRSIPQEVMDAAELDGAGHLQRIWYIGLPLGKAGIMSAMFLSFIESWNMLEAPMAFLETKSLWPMGLYLPKVGMERMGFAFAASVISLVLPLLIFLGGKDSLESGIQAMGVKE